MDQRVLRRAIVIAALIAVTILTGTIGFQVIDGYPLFDAFYMTLITISTVGYVEVRPLSHAGRVFNSFLIMFGVTAMFFAVGAMTQTIVEMQLEDRFGQRRKKRAIMRLSDHHIVCGYGRVGRTAAFELQRADAAFVVVDRNPERVARASSAGMLAFQGDATRDESLREAGVERARGFIAALPTDAENVFVILSARNLNPHLTVVTRASEEEAEEKLRRAGADTVFSPYRMAGRRLAQALIRPHVVQLLDFSNQSAGRDLAMEQLNVSAGSKLISRSVAELPRGAVLVLAVRRRDGEIVFNPAPEFRLSEGDSLILMGEQRGLRDLEAALLKAFPAGMR